MTEVTSAGACNMRFALVSRTRLTNAAIGVPGDRQARKHPGGQHAKMAAPHALDHHAWLGTHATLFDPLPDNVHIVSIIISGGADNCRRV